MLHRRYDWRRPLVWVAICLIFFLSSQKAVNNKANDPLNDLAKVGNQQSVIINRKWVK